MSAPEAVPTVVSTNPANPAEIVARVPAVGSAEVDARIESAARAGAAWWRDGAAARAAALTRLADRLESEAPRLAALVCREVGKPIAEAGAEVDRAVAIVRYHAQGALDPDGHTLPPPPGTWLLTARRRPRGVCALITPWNFPLAIPLWKAAPALAAGNSVVIKPASPAVGCGLALAEAFDDVLPEGLASVLPGGGAVGSALVEHSGVACLSFTGSERIGRSLVARCGERALPVQAEMGGQNPSIVLADADLDLAAATVANAAMGFAGQKCTATSRIVVEESVLEPFSAKLGEAVAALGYGDPAAEGVAIGPVISADSRQEAEQAASAAEGRGATVAARGAAGPSSADGHFVAPTVLTVADPGDELAQEEVFAPVAALVPAADREAAVEIANGVRFGLSAALFTRDLAAAAAVSGRLEAGLVRVNQSTAGVDLHAPFGGVKGSSHGPREQGKAAREFFTETQTMSVAG